MPNKRRNVETYYGHVRSFAVEAKTGYRPLPADTSWQVEARHVLVATRRRIAASSSRPMPLQPQQARTAARTDREVVEIFDLLSAKVLEEALFSASMREIFQSPTYQRIIGLGPQALPLVLRLVMRDRSAVWFWALAAIVGDDKAEGAESVAAAAAAWLEWGQSRDLL